MVEFRNINVVGQIFIGCETILCAENYFDMDNNIETGCETSCSLVTDGICTACTTSLTSGCTAVTCSENKFDTNNNTTDGKGEQED